MSATTCRSTSLADCCDSKEQQQEQHQRLLSLSGSMAEGRWNRRQTDRQTGCSGPLGRGQLSSRPLPAAALPAKQHQAGKQRCCVQRPPLPPSRITPYRPRLRSRAIDHLSRRQRRLRCHGLEQGSSSVRGDPIGVGLALAADLQKHKGRRATSELGTANQRLEIP